MTIIVATFGHDRWRELAHERAIPSAEGQRVPVIARHGSTLHGARNDASRDVSSEWLCFLDADDELAPGYIDAMSRASGDLRAPAVQWVTGKTETVPRTLHDRDIEHMNPCVIGTLIRRETFDDLDGFRDLPAWEDWDLFLRAHRAGAVIEHAPAAVYRAWLTPGSRNQTVRNPRRLARLIRHGAAA